MTQTELQLTGHMKPRTAKTLRAITGRWMSSLALLDAGCGMRAVARIHELRKAGYVIEDRMGHADGIRWKQYRWDGEMREAKGAV